jgi:hypothetical protein
MVSDLPFEAFGKLIQGRRRIGTRSLGTEGLPRDGQDALHPMGTTQARVALDSDLDLQQGGPGLHACESGQFVLGCLSDLVGDAGAAALEGELHLRPPHDPRDLPATWPVLWPVLWPVIWPVIWRGPPPG